VGLAISDADGKLAMPLSVLHQSGERAQVEAILQVAREQGAEAIVVGMPYTLRGEVGPSAQSVQAHVRRLEEAGDLPVQVWDERFSSGIAENVLLEADVSRAERKRHIDKLAATVMLQSFLDRQAACLSVEATDEGEATEEWPPGR